MNHNPDPYQQFAPEEQTPRQANNNSSSRPCQQKCDLGFSKALPLHWNPPVTRTEWNKRGGANQDVALIFSSWTRWTQKQCKRSTSSLGPSLFVRHEGAIAVFLQQRQFVGMAVYQLRVLSSSPFQTQHQSSVSNHDQAKWLECTPSGDCQSAGCAHHYCCIL